MDGGPLKGWPPAGLAAVFAGAPRVVLAAAQLYALLWFTPSIHGFPLDDAWIHQVVARTWATTGTLGFAPGQHGAGATSYLWALLVGLNLKIFHVDVVRFALVINIVASLATGQLLYALIARVAPDGVSKHAWNGAAFAGTALAMLNGNVLWLAYSGMEVVLFVALTLGAIFLANRAKEDEKPKHLVAAGVLAGLVALTRPEGIPLGAFLVVFHLFKRRRPKDAAMLGGPWLAGVLAYVGVNLANTGHTIPATLAGRRWLWLQIWDGAGKSDHVGELFRIWGDRLNRYVLDGSPLMCWIVLGLAIYGLVRLAQTKNDGARLLLFWSVFHVGFYIALLPTPGHGGRYQPFVPLLVCAGTVMGTVFLARDIARLVSEKRGPTRGVAVGAVASLGWFVMAIGSADTMRHANDLAIAHVRHTELGTGEYLKTLPKDAVVASFDIGGIGWAAERPVLDVGGLSDPKTATALELGGIPELLRDKKVTHLALPDTWDEEFPVSIQFTTRLHLRESTLLRLKRVYLLETPIEEWLPGVEATWHAASRQVVLSVEYTDKKAPDARPVVPPDARRGIFDPQGRATTRDRLVAERSLGMLEAWGLPVEVSVVREAPTDDVKSAGCRIAVGTWGIDVAGCKDVGTHAVLESLLYEHVGRFLLVPDFGGAMRMIPHVVARVKRRTAPTFDPPLPPVFGPKWEERNGVERTKDWGVYVTLGVLLLCVAVAAVQDERARRIGSKIRAKLPLAAAPALLVVFGAASCRGAPDLASAAGEGRGALEAALACGAALEGKDGNGRTALLVAADRGDADAVALLLSRGANADEKGRDGLTALHLAARRMAAPCIAMLARASKHLETTAGQRSRTPLLDAVATGDPDTVSALLRAGADPKKADSFGETALHIVTHNRDKTPGVVPLLLDTGADPLAYDKRGFTVLHGAAFSDNVVVLRLVFAKSKEGIEAKTPSGETALDVALRYRIDRASEVLIAAGASVPDASRGVAPLHEAAQTDDVARAARMISFGADLKRALNGKTAQQIAHEAAHTRVERLLADAAAARSGDQR